MKDYILFILVIAFVILTMFLIICNTNETFRMPKKKDTHFLSKNCFDRDSVSSFEDYYNVADVSEIKDKAMLFTTPIEKVKELSNFKLNSYGKGLLINNMCVCLDNRREGLAKTLLNKTIEKAKKDPNINFLFLQVKDSNTAAKSLYTKLGFKNIHKFNNLSGETFINMILRV